jgi:hypothetical protein
MGNRHPSKRFPSRETIDYEFDYALQGMVTPGRGPCVNVQEDGGDGPLLDACGAVAPDSQPSKRGSIPLGARTR